MIVLKYQESTTEKFFENDRIYQGFWGGRGAKKIQKKYVSGGSGIKKFSNFLMSQIDIDNIFPG